MEPLLLSALLISSPKEDWPEKVKFELTLLVSFEMFKTMKISCF